MSDVRPPTPSPLPFADREDEMKICGVAACRAVFQNRPEAIIKVWLEDSRAPAFGEEMRWLASQRLGYRVTDGAELAKVSGSTHHEGICVLLRAPPPPPSPARLAAELAARPGPATVILLEDIGNPHNLGAIMRVAAHFGAAAVIACGRQRAGFSSAAARSAEGGFEKLVFIDTENPLPVLRSFASAGFRCLATSGHARDDLYAVELPPKLLIVFGSEADGLTRDCQQACQGDIAIPGSGSVESLNVATAAATVLGEVWRRQHSR